MSTNKSDDKSIFNIARNIECPVARADYIQQVGGEDPDLIDRVNALLSGYEKQHDFLESPALAIGGTCVATTITEKLGTQIGPYKLREKIGEGGFGVVYVAEQKKPVARKVALKVIKPGMDSKDVIARFEAERQALAMMDHPNVAKVLDAGATESGRPYFVMELVHGTSITKFCDAQKLTNQQRLELFVDVCRAVQHAHQKGIIHRDLKPTNVMVTMADHRAVVKVIDFGVAKALHHKLTDKSVYTGYGQMIGTPMYMSPEQAQMSSLDVDTRCDVYSLGVLLYELLTGTVPFDKETFKLAEFDEIRRIIREDDPPRPSDRVSTLNAELQSTISEQRKVDERALSQSLRGDLDWIVMKTLEKDRTRRYETANGLAADVQRFLDDEPVLACPPSTIYKFRKFARRNKARLTLVSLVGVFMVLGFIGLAFSNYQLSARERQTQAALTRAEKAEKAANDRAKEVERQSAITLAVQEFFNKKILTQANPRKQKKGITLLEALDAAGKKVGNEFPGQPLVEAEIRATLCETYCGLGEYEKAQFHAAKATELRKRNLGEFASETLSVKVWLVFLEQKREGDRDSREANMEQLLETCEEHLGRDHKATQRAMNMLGMTYSLNSDDAGQLWRWLAENSAYPEQKFWGMFNLGNHKWARGENEEAKQLFEQAYEHGKTVFGEDHYKVVSALSIVGSICSESGDLENGLPLLEKACAKLKTLVGPNDNMMLITQTNLGLAYRRIGRLEEAEKCIVGIVSADWDSLHDWSRAYETLSAIYARQGRLPEAEKAARDAVAAHAVCNEPGCALNFAMRNNLAQVLGYAGRYDEQCQFLRTSVDMHNIRLKREPDVAPPSLVYDLRLLSIGLKHLDRHGEAEAVMARLIEVNDRVTKNSTGYGKTKHKLIRCETLARSGEHQFAANEVELFANEKNMTADLGWNGSHWPKSAAVFALCSHTVLADQSLTEDEQQDKAQQYKIRAIEYLEKAVEHLDSFTAENLYFVTTSDDFQPLHDREDFQILLGQMKSIVEAKSQQSRSSGEAGREAGEDSKLDTERPETLISMNRRAMRSHVLGRYEEAQKLHRELLEILEPLAADDESHNRRLSLVCNNLAWLLATCPDKKLHDHLEALALAKRAVALSPKDGDHFNTLGVCQYRADQWRDAIKSLKKSMDLGTGSDKSHNTFFLAMAHWQLGEQNESRKWFEKAVRWMDANAPYDEELLRFRDEADELLTTQEAKD